MKELISFVRKYRGWIVAAILVLAAGYSVFNRAPGDKQAQSEPSPSASAISSPTASSAPLQSAAPIASQSPVSTSIPDETTLRGGRFFDLDQATGTVYYFDELSGNLRKYSLTSKTSETIVALPGLIEQFAWSPNHMRALIMYKSGSDELSLAEQSLLGKEVALFDIAENKLTPLNKNIVSFEFITNGKIVYHYKDAKFSNLSVADANGENWKNIGHVSDSILFKRLGDTVLTQLITSKSVTRYDSNGKKVADYTVPDQFFLDRSMWSDQPSALYWTSDPSATSINRFTPGRPNQLIGLAPLQADPVILWDNKKGDIYLASFDGLVKLDLKAGAQ